MLIWPGLWPGVGIRGISSVSWWSLATRSALPASAIGFTESSNTASLSDSSWLWSRQYSYSVWPNTYRAFAKVGTHWPPTSFVFQPTWSTWRCVHSTMSMLSGAKPALVSVSRNGVVRLFQVGTLRPCLSLPSPVSTTMRRVGVSTTSEWIDIFSRPSSVAKCRISQGSFRISSLVAAGRMKRVEPTVSISTSLVILTLPTFHCIRRIPMFLFDVLALRGNMRSFALRRNGSSDAVRRYRGNPGKDKGPAMPELAISAEKVAFIIEKAREFDVKQADSDPDSGSNATDDDAVDVLEDDGSDPVVNELGSFIVAMNEDEQIDLVALTWL